MASDSMQPTQILLTFKKSPSETISYHIEGNDRNWVFLTQSLIDDRIKNIKQLNTLGESGALLFMAAIVCFAFDIIFISSLFDRTYTLSIAPTLAYKVIAIF